MKRLKLHSPCHFTEADRDLLTRLDASVAALLSDSGEPKTDDSPSITCAIETMESDPARADALSRSLEDLRCPADPAPADSHSIRSEIMDLKRAVGVNDGPSGETFERLFRDVRCLKHEMRHMKLSGQPSAVFHALEKKVQELADAVPEGSLEEIRQEMESLKMELRRLLTVGERSPAIERLISVVAQEVRVVLQTDIDRKLREMPVEKHSGEDAVVGVAGWERELAAIRTEIEEIRRQIGAPPGFSQVFVDLPTVAAVQLVFRAGH
jgi:hypothetical protein